MKILVTGSSGFVGSNVIAAAYAQGWSCVQQCRQQYGSTIDDAVFVSNIDANTNWNRALSGVECIVHCAARVHQMKDDPQSALKHYREVNTAGTINLARQAHAAGVKRFVFISSIKVNGEYTQIGQPFRPDSNIAPADPYALSKYEAEMELQQLAQETGLEVVIIRPPLVYGPGVKANFQSMMRWIEKGVPLPLGAIHNQRSLVYIDNLVDLILVCCEHHNAVGKTFLVSDDHDVSTSQLLKQVESIMAKSNRILPMPMNWIELSAKLLGKPQIARRLCGNLQVDISQTKALLEWRPQVSFEEGIRRTVNAYLGRE